MSEKILVHIDPDLEDLIPGFLQNRANDVESLRDLVKRRDYAAIRLIGHSMKGAGGGYGFDLITDYGSRIEAAAVDEDGKTITDTVEQLADYLSRVEVVCED